MARIKVYDQNKKAWVYADKSFSKAPTAELIPLANYEFITSDGTATSFNDAIVMMLNSSLMAGGNVQTMSGTDVDGGLFSAVGSTDFNAPMFLATFGVGIVLWKPEMLFFADSEFQLSFSSFIKLAGVGNVEVKVALNLFSDKTADIFLRATIVSA
jgi:hypothetical protein